MKSTGKQLVNPGDFAHHAWHFIAECTGQEVGIGPLATPYATSAARSSWPHRILFLAMLVLCAAHASAADEPRGLQMRKGLVAWQVSLSDARPSIEENIRPKTLNLLANQKPEGFGCTQERTRGVSRCNWACCIDLGEPGIVQFATLWFFNDRFYAYDVTFDTPQFARLDSALRNRLGAPSKELQETQVSPNVLQGGISSYVVNTKRWDVGNVVVLLEDRGGQGKLLAGHIYVTYLPLGREANPPGETEQ